MNAATRGVLFSVALSVGACGGDVEQLELEPAAELALEVSDSDSLYLVDPPQSRVVRLARFKHNSFQRLANALGLKVRILSEKLRCLPTEQCEVHLVEVSVAVGNVSAQGSAMFTPGDDGRYEANWIGPDASLDELPCDSTLPLCVSFTTGMMNWEQCAEGLVVVPTGELACI